MTTIQNSSHQTLKYTQIHAAKHYSTHTSPNIKKNIVSDHQHNTSSKETDSTAKREFKAQLKKDYQQLQKSIAEDAYLIDLGPLTKQVIQQILSKQT